MRIIDVHTHAWPDPVAEKAVPSLMSKGTLTAYYDGTVAGFDGFMAYYAPVVG